MGTTCAPESWATPVNFEFVILLRVSRDRGMGKRGRESLAFNASARLARGSLEFVSSLVYTVSPRPARTESQNLSFPLPSTNKSFIMACLILHLAEACVTLVERKRTSYIHSLARV